VRGTLQPEKIVLKPSKSHLKKANIDISKKFTAFLLQKGFVDIASIEKGRSHKVLLDIELNSSGQTQLGVMSLYRTVNRGTRFWIHNLNKFVNNGDTLEFTEQDGMLITTILRTSNERHVAWTDDEIELCVTSYVAMHAAIRAGQRIVKNGVYSSLSKRKEFSNNNRSVKAIEYRFCNISTVMRDRGEEPIPGLLPRDNVGRILTERINKSLDRLL